MKLQGAIFDTRGMLLDETGSPLPGLMPFLSWMKMEGVWMYAVCDGSMNETRQALEQAGLWSYFRGILDTREHGKGMADPVVYERTVKRLRTAPRATPVFTRDLDAAKAAKEYGLPVVFLGDGGEEVSALADQVIATYEEMTQ